MALLKPSTKIKKTQIRINIDSDILGKVKSYCDFAEIHKLDEFFEQAAEFVMSKDRDWQRQYKPSKMNVCADQMNDGVRLPDLIA